MAVDISTQPQRQSRQAQHAQLHNLSVNRLPTLFNIAANVPPPGVELLWIPQKGIDRTRVPQCAVSQLHNISTNLQPTLFNTGVNLIPDGKDMLDMPVKAFRRLQPDLLFNNTLITDAAPTGTAVEWDRTIARAPKTVQYFVAANLQPTLYNLNQPLPDGETVLWYPQKTISQEGLVRSSIAQLHNISINLQPTLYAPSPLPDGEILLWNPQKTVDPEKQVRAAISQLHNLSVNLQPTLFNESINVPPIGKLYYPEAIRRPTQRFAALVRVIDGVPAVFITVTVPAPVILEPTIAHLLSSGLSSAAIFSNGLSEIAVLSNGHSIIHILS